jgi:acetyl esterase/lipase
MRLPLFAFLCCVPLAAQQQSDVIYGYKFGTALVMDVLSPAKPNGAGVILVMSGGMNSDPVRYRSWLNKPHTRALLDRGYAVFAVYHGSQPKYTIPEIEQDLLRAVRFIRHNAARFRIHSERLGIMGFSSGGHLALFTGMAGKVGSPDAPDPVDREPSRLRAVVAYFGGGDFSNFGGEGMTVEQAPLGRGRRGPFDYHEWSGDRGRFERITDDSRYRKLLLETSPAAHVTPDDPPTLLLHGDMDMTVPIQQSRLMLSLLEKAGVPAKLEVKPGLAHGWQPDAAELALVTGWFDRYLLK